MPSPNLNFRAPEALLAKVKSRDPYDLKMPGTVVKRDLERWYAALDDAMLGVRLTPAQAVLLIRVVRDAERVGEAFVSNLVIHVERHPIEGWDRWRTELAHTVAACDQLTRWAMVDAAERYLAYAEKNPDASMGMALHTVGLHTYELTTWELEILEKTIASVLELPKEW
jgi:hypothetical protein